MAAVAGASARIICDLLVRVCGAAPRHAARLQVEQQRRRVLRDLSSGRPASW
jgi:hypothetical protein